MGLRFRKSVKIAPGVKVNFNKKSVGVTVGGKGFHHTVNTSGRKTTSAGIPGTGLSYSSTLQSKKSKPQATTQTSREPTSTPYKPFDNKAVSKSRPASQPRKKGKALKIWGVVLICISVIGMISLFVDGDFYDGLIGGGVLLIVGVLLFIKGKKKLTYESESYQPQYTNMEFKNNDYNESSYSPEVYGKEFEDAIKLKSENFKVAGTSHRQKELESLCEENVIFSCTKRELIDDGYVDERIYKYESNPSDVQIVPEPDNPYDPQALKVIVDNVHIGYIKKGSTGRVRNLLKNNPAITAEIHGGPYKIIYSDYDDSSDKEVYTLEKDAISLSAKLCFSYKVLDELETE